MHPDVRCAMRQACQSGFKNVRPNSFEVFGLDFMIDEDLGVWLLEANLTPDMSHSTQVTPRGALRPKASNPDPVPLGHRGARVADGGGHGQGDSGLPGHWDALAQG